eukprot:g6370.t1
MHWKNWLSSTPRGYVAATVEARPLESDSFVTWHCADCFRFGLDLVIPSAVASAEARRLQGFNRQPADRTLLLTWRGEHAESSARSDVRQGYLEVNETVRPRILKTFQSKEDADVGRSSMRYSFLMGNAHFCLVPRGRGWWTVRLFESFYAGCIPVLLSDDVELPFQEFLSWETFSVKWPMDRVDLGLYEHLQHLQQDEVKLERLHRMVREVACWFDYLQPMEASCSPYQGFLKLLALKALARVDWVVATATKLREKEHKHLATSVAQGAAAVDVLHKAANSLEKYLQEGGTLGGTPSGGGDDDSEFGFFTEASKGSDTGPALRSLTSVIASVKSEVEQVKLRESTDQAAYVGLVEVAKSSRRKDAFSLTDFVGGASALAAESQRIQDRQKALKEQMGLTDELAMTLNAECEKLMANFEAKKTMRSQEIDALEAKKKALEPWPEAVELCESLVANLWS